MDGARTDLSQTGTTEWILAALNEPPRSLALD